MLHRRSRRRLILYRWISLVWCGIVAATVIFLSDPLLRRLFAPAVDRLSILDPTAITLTLAVLIGTGCWFVGEGRWRGFFGIRFFFTYPPLWVAVLIALGVLCRKVPMLLWITLFLLVGGLTVVLRWRDVVALLRRFRNVRSQPSDTKHGQAADDFDALLARLRDDSPVDKPALDWFHHDDIARRMADRLQSGKTTMAVIGPLGSGKSTICKLVEHHLQNTRNVRLIQVSLWPFDSAEAAVRGILGAVIKELGRHVNVLPLIGLSEDYITAIEKTAGTYGGIARMFRGKSDPEEILQQLSKIACAAGLRLVLWIEDLERFSGGDQLEGGARDEREVERLGPIRALLHLLDNCPEVSIVLSDTSLRSRFDIEKIARFVEQVPQMETESVWRRTNLLRERCLGGYPVAVIDPTAPEVRQAFVPAQDPFRLRKWLSEFGDLSVFESLVRVLKTPRALKGALRITLEVWEAIPGEIDFDSVLVASGLREARPTLFALVSEHVDLFRNGLRDPFSHGDREREPHAVVDRIDELLKHEDERTAASLRKLLGFLFPKYTVAVEQKGNGPSQNEGDKEDVSRPQAMFVDGDADYWQRYLAQTRVSEAESDQKALASIVARRSGNVNDLIDRVVDPQRGRQITCFVGQFLPSDLCRLIGEVADRVSKQSAGGWKEGIYAPGIGSVWQMMHIKPPPEDLVYRTVVDIIQRYAPIHLPLAVHVAELFAASNPKVHRFMSDAQKQDVRQQLLDALPANFIGEGAENRLAGALRGGPPLLIYWIVYGDRDDRTAPPFEHWPEFSGVLLTLAESWPAIGVPLVVGLITKSDNRPTLRRGAGGEAELERCWVGEFDAEAAKRLFDYCRLVRILSKFEVPDDLDENMKACCVAAVDAARAEVNAS